MIRKPRWLRARLKLALIDFAMVGAAQIADDDNMPARERIKAGWHVHWLIRYGLRLRAILAPPNTDSETE